MRVLIAQWTCSKIQWTAHLDYTHIKL